MIEKNAAGADSMDNHVDNEIAACLDFSAPRSFFLFAGAGSGKTRSLVMALKHVQKNLAGQMTVKGQRVAVITFTNAARDEIRRRLLFDPLLDVSTIHSFSWSLIEGLNTDIRKWLQYELQSDITQLQHDEAKGRKGTGASAERLRKIESKNKRLQLLPDIKRFVYSPTGENHGRDSLNHSEVLQLTAHFLKAKPVMQSILVGRYPILLIDESQDTNKNLVDALFEVEATHSKKFILGLVGDMMQRIYSDGKEGLGQHLPTRWARPSKQLNFRCSRRIVSLINKVRSAVDHQHQEARSDAPEGVVRLFIVPGDCPNKQAAELAICRHMAMVTEEKMWLEPNATKTLTLEHRMAAARIGFLEIFAPLYAVESWRTGFLDGSLPVATFFSNQVLPLVKARIRADKFEVTRIAKLYSPLLSQEALRDAPDKREQLRKVNAAIDELVTLWDNGGDPSLLEVLQRVLEQQLLVPPDILIESLATPTDLSRGAQIDERQSERSQAMAQYLAAPFSQVEPCAEYLSGRAHFDTHQGVKGLEFDRVMVIMDDGEARGFMFKYEDLFGGKPSGGKTVDATKRLFYVTCSRAKQNLALVAYSTQPQRIRDFVLAEGWFEQSEIVIGVPG